jgi:hypothetical protein
LLDAAEMAVGKLQMCLLDVDGMAVGKLQMCLLDVDGQLEIAPAQYWRRPSQLSSGVVRVPGKWESQSNRQRPANVWVDISCCATGRQMNPFQRVESLKPMPGGFAKTVGVASGV